MNPPTKMPVPRIGLWAIAATAALLLSACGSSKPLPRPPVEDRSAGRQAASPAVPAPASSGGATASPARVAPDGRLYTVRPGDTLVRIGLDQGQNWRDIARWNNLDNPNLIEVGQVLRVSPPATEAPARTAAAPPGGAVASPATGTQSMGTQPVGASRVEARPLESRPDPAAEPARPAASRVDAGAGGTASVEEVVWAWPASGPLLATFEEQRNNKGIDIGGKAGDPVLAAAEGRVVYAGSGLRGYGNLVIIKHNATFLTAYAHNQTLLVKEDQAVRRGQRIAEMGSTDADRVQLHFEIRREGRPVDPLKYLPAR